MGKVLFLKDRMGDNIMNTIWDEVNFNPYERPKYTKYEISAKIIAKRKDEGLNIHEFAQKYGVDERILLQVEEAKRSFNVKLYNVCSKILGLSLSELLEMDKEDDLCVSYRKDDSCCDDDVKETVELANVIFNEMVMQSKINTRG